MEVADGQRSLLGEYLGGFELLIDDRRTGRAFRATVAGIIGGASDTGRRPRSSTG